MEPKLFYNHRRGLFHPKYIEIGPVLSTFIQGAAAS